MGRGQGEVGREREQGAGTGRQGERNGGRRLFGAGRKIFHNRLGSGTYYRVEGVEKAKRPCRQYRRWRSGSNLTRANVPARETRQGRASMASMPLSKSASWGTLPTYQEYDFTSRLAT